MAKFAKEQVQFFVDEKKGNVKRSWKCVILIALILIISLATFIAGIVLLHSETCVTIKRMKKETSKSIKNLDVYCEPSVEAKRIGLQEFLAKCQKLYFKLYPNEELNFNANADQDKLNKIARKFVPFIPTPEFLKDFADQSKQLLDELLKLTPDESRMKPKENQILAEIKIFLGQFMSLIFDIDFYAGDWMFGPNYFCQNRICTVGDDINTLTYYFRPKTEDDIEFLIKTFHSYNETFHQYILNLQFGVTSGMVKSQLSCKAGADAFKQMYFSLILLGKKAGTTESYFSKNIKSNTFYSRLSKKLNKKVVAATLNKALMDGFSEPLIKFHEYLTNVHYKHCPPDDVASGVSSLPLNYIYTNGAANLSQPTTKKLPLVNTLLSGSEMYKKFVKSFTTTDMTPEEIYEEGKKQLDIFYPMIVNISKKITNDSNEDTAVEKIKKIIDGDEQWHAQNFPEIESNATAHARCVDDKSAKKYCPVRWKGIKKWGNYLNSILSMIHPELFNAFHFTGDFNSVPNCPIEMQPHYNPSNGAMYFRSSDTKCSTPSYYGLPFFLEKYGPRFQEWSVNGHEARPGHQFQFQGSLELFSNPCTGGLDSFFHSKGYFVGFIEGWALYGENPVLSDDVDLYKNNLMQKLGMYKWQIWRAVRLVVDTGLHNRGMTRTQALKEFEKYAWDTTDFGRKEITRYMSCPGQATGYMIGRLAILKARKKTEKELGDKFNLKDFHYQILSLGQVPLDYMTKHIDRYIDCVKDSSKMYCEYIMTPIKAIKPGSKLDEEVNIQPHLSRRHYM